MILGVARGQQGTLPVFSPSLFQRLRAGGINKTSHRMDRCPIGVVLGERFDFVGCFERAILFAA
jgi:hypothetical protein